MLRQIFPWELDAQEIRLYHLAIETDETSGTVEEVSKAVMIGLLLLFVWQTRKSSCVIICQVEGQGEDSDLLIRMLAGDGASKEFDEICDELKSVGSVLKTNNLTAVITPEKWEAFQRHGAHGEIINHIITFGPCAAEVEDQKPRWSITSEGRLVNE